MQAATESLESPAPDTSDLARKLNALAHPARLEILRHLAEHESRCCREVVGQLSLAQSTVSQHLKVLVEAGIVRYAADRQRSRYEIDRKAMAELANALSGVLDQCCAPRASCCGSEER